MTVLRCDRRPLVNGETCGLPVVTAWVDEWHHDGLFFSKVMIRCREHASTFPRLMQDREVSLEEALVLSVMVS